MVFYTALRIIGGKSVMFMRGQKEKNLERTGKRRNRTGGRGGARHPAQEGAREHLPGRKAQGQGSA